MSVQKDDSCPDFFFKSMASLNGIQTKVYMHITAHYIHGMTSIGKKPANILFFFVNLTFQLLYAYFFELRINCEI